MIDDGFEEAWKRLQDEISKTVPNDAEKIQTDLAVFGHAFHDDQGRHIDLGSIYPLSMVLSATVEFPASAPLECAALGAAMSVPAPGDLTIRQMLHPGQTPR